MIRIPMKIQNKQCPFECGLYFFSIQCLLSDRKCYITELACKMLEFHSSKCLMYHLFLEAVLFCFLFADLIFSLLYLSSFNFGPFICCLIYVINFPGSTHSPPPSPLLHNKLNALIEDYLLFHGLFIYFIIH